MKSVPLREAKQQLSEYVLEAQKERILITKHGKPAALIWGISNRQSLSQPSENQIFLLGTGKISFRFGFKLGSWTMTMTLIPRNSPLITISSTIMKRFRRNFFGPRADN